MTWPLSQDYNEAIQSPKSNFTDADLQRGEAVANALGLPMPFSGNFADVYQVRCPDGKSWAVKCFTREAAGLRERYQEISAHLKQAKLPFTVDFSYLDKGIRVAGLWYPVLKMQWVEGLTLNQFIGQNLEKPVMLEALLQLWARMGKYLRAAEIGHCDLQHGNVLLVPGATPKSLALKLIDYDGMWVPGLAGKKSGEVGHPCYQHPQRLREGTYSLDVDRFPLLLVATAMRALKADKGLWAKYDNGDNMLFKESDLAEPGQSEVFQELASLPDAGLVMLAAHVRAALKGPLESAPLLEEAMPDAKGAAPAPKRPSKQTASAAEGPRSGTKASPVVVAPVVAPPAAEKTFAFDESGPAAAASSTRLKRTKPKARAGGLPPWAWIAGAAAAVVLIGGAAAAFVAMSGPPKPPVGPQVVQQLPPGDSGSPGKPPVKPPPDPTDPVKAPVKPDDHPDSHPPMAAQTDPEGIDPDPKGSPGEVRRFKGHTDLIRKLSVSPDGKQLLTAGFDKTLRLWDVATGHELLKWEGPVGRKMHGVAFLPDGKRALFCCNEDKNVHLWNLAANQEIRSFQGHTDTVWNLAVTRDGRAGASCGPESTVFLWDIETGNELHRLEGNTGGVESVAFSPDGKLLLTGSIQGPIRLWSVETGKEVRAFAGHSKNVMGMAFAPDGTWAVSCALDKTICAWRVEDGQELRRFEGVAFAVWNVAISPDGSKVLTANDDGTMRLWDAATGKELYRFPAGQQAVWTVAFSPDGHYAFSSGNAERWVRMWRLPPADYVPPPTPDTTPVVKKPESKPAAPDDASLAAAEKEVKDVYKAEFAKKKKEDVLALADKLRQQGIDTKDKPATRFVLFRESRDLAARAGDFVISRRAVNEMANYFAVNFQEMNVQAVEFAARSILAPGVMIHVAEAALVAAEDAVDGDDYDMADRAIETAGAAAHSAGSPAMENIVRGRAIEIEALRKGWEPAQAAVQTLTAKRDDPDANLAVGKFYCLDKGNWDLGLPMLALGSDPKLKDLAQKDLASPADADAREELARTYTTLAEAESGALKTPFLRRASYWYQEAEAQLMGISRTEATKKVAEVEKGLPLLPPKILWAAYGGYNSWVDVTATARSMLVEAQAKGQKLAVKADSGELGIGDPLPFKTKTLVVVYRHREQVRLGIAKDGDAVAVPGQGAQDTESRNPAPGQELVILYARVGAEATFADATARAQQLVQGPSLVANANDLVTADPFPGRQKAVIVVYCYGGKVRLSATPQEEKTALGAVSAKP